jgi:hypothetical protein
VVQMMNKDVDDNNDEEVKMKIELEQMVNP